MRNCRISQNPKTGFTLIELLVSMMIVSFLGAAIFVTFAQGVRVWQTVLKRSEKGQQEFFFEELESDIRNAFVFKKVSMDGKRLSLDFFVPIKQIRGRGTQRKVLKVPARVRYYLQADQKEIRKDVFFYEDALNDAKEPALSQVLLKGVVGLNMEYYRHPQNKSAASWISQWNDSCFPEAVKVMVDMAGSGNTKITKIVPLPSVGTCPEQEAV